MDSATATAILHGLLDNTLQNYEVEGVSNTALKAVQLCLNAGADLTVPMTSANPEEPPTSLLAGSVHRPQAALLLLQAGVPIEPDVMMSLSQSKGPRATQGELFEAYQQMAITIAMRGPHLPWHTKVPGRPGGFHDFVPACMRIEDEAPGFNAALEKEQLRLGLPVGCIPHIKSREDREVALGELVLESPDLYSVGDRSRVEILHELMQNDIPVDMIVEGPTEDHPERLPVTLLESVLNNLQDEDVVVELLNRGATVSPGAMCRISHVPYGLNEEYEIIRKKVFLLLLQRGGVDLDTLLPEESSAGGLSLRQYLREEDPHTMALFESHTIDHKTSNVSRKSRGHRL